MLKCFSFKSSTSSSTIPNPSQGNPTSASTSTTAYSAPVTSTLPSSTSSNPTQNDCVRALRLFHPFHALQNPIPDSHTFSVIRSNLSDLKTQLDHRIAKSLWRLRLSRRVVRGSAISLFAVVISVVAATVVVTVHAVAALAAAAGTVPVCAFEKKELAALRQLDAAEKCAYGLSNDLATIDALASRLRTTVEGDKVLVRLRLERGNERYLVEEVIKQLWNSGRVIRGFWNRLRILRGILHIFLCFYNINKARFLVLQ